MRSSLAAIPGVTQNIQGLDERPARVVSWADTLGDLSTQRFSHLNMGEVGVVHIGLDARLKVISETLRDWGRGGWCPSVVDSIFSKRLR